MGRAGVNAFSRTRLGEAAGRLADIAATLLADDKGLLAMDESTATCNRRFAALSIPETEESRRAWRELILTTPGLNRAIGGAILVDETIRQSTKAGVPFVALMADAGIVPGIKVDAGAKPLAGHDGETVTEGLDGLRERLQEYAALGARFAKWRGVIAIDAEAAGRPSTGCIEANAHALARYAALCQEAGLVPIVEPEVLMDGDHTLARCAEVTQAVLLAVFEQLQVQGVVLEGMLLKPNMVMPGSGCATPATVDAVAGATVQTLLRCVPAAVAGVAFLSGGQSPERASAHLNAMQHIFGTASAPWPLAFSYARAIQQPALDLWRGEDRNVTAAQEILLHRALCNQAARRGVYDSALDRP